MKTAPGKLSAWLPAIAAVAGAAVFAATLFAYFSAHASGARGSQAPLIVGSLAFCGIVGAVAYAASANSARRIWWTAAASLIAGVCFILAVLFVLLNSLGS